MGPPSFLAEEQPGEIVKHIIIEGTQFNRENSNGELRRAVPRYGLIIVVCQYVAGAIGGKDMVDLPVSDHGRRNGLVCRRCSEVTFLRFCIKENLITIRLLSVSRSVCLPILGAPECGIFT